MQFARVGLLERRFDHPQDRLRVYRQFSPYDTPGDR
jgi:hypothetical protein